MQSLMNLLNKRCMGFGWLSNRIHSMYYGMRCLVMLVANNGMLVPALGAGWSHPAGCHRGHRCSELQLSCRVPPLQTRPEQD